MAHVVFIPGIMGSELYINDAKKWPAIMPGALKAISLKDKTEFYDTRPLLTYFEVKKIYKKINRFLDHNFESYDFFSYDWRHDLLSVDTFERLKTRLEGKDDIVLVAHSMGGLLASLFCQWCTEEGHTVVNKIQKVITLATPWRGSPDALWKLYFGEPHPFPEMPLTSAEIMKRVSSTFPSVYQLLPRQNAIPENDLVHDPNFKRNLNYKEIYDSMLNRQQKQYFEVYVNGFIEKITKSWPEHISTYAMIGQGYSTIKTIQKPKVDENDIVYSKERMCMGAGDLTVPVGYAQPYDETTTCQYVRATHQGIVNNSRVLNWVKDMIFDETTVELFDSGPSEEYSGDIIRIACPVKVSVYKEGDGFIAGEANDLEELKNQLEYFTSQNEDDGDLEVVDEVKVLGDTTYVFTQRQNNYKYKIEGKEQGIASIEITKYKEGEILERNVFPSIEVREGEISTLNVDSLEHITLSLSDGFTIPSKLVDSHDVKNGSRPITKVSYMVQGNTVEIPSDAGIIIQSPIKFKFQIDSISEEDYLETIVIVNGEKHVSLNYEFIFSNPLPGPNDIIIYSVTKNGLIEDIPTKLRFILDVEAPETKFAMLLFKDKIQLILRAEDDSKGEVRTKYMLSTENVINPHDYSKNGIKLNYADNEVVEFFSIDMVGHRENSKSVRLPDHKVRQSIFESRPERYKQIAEILGFDVESVNITANNKDVNPEHKIRKNISNVSITTQSGDIYSIVLSQSTDVLWTLHPNEILDEKNARKPYPFKFKLVTEDGFIKGDNVTVKLVPKGLREASIIINNVVYDENNQEYEGNFSIDMVPRSVREGKVQILINNKIQRELIFKII